MSTHMNLPSRKAWCVSIRMCVEERGSKNTMGPLEVVWVDEVDEG